MAGYAAIAATSEALVRLLRTSYVPADFNNVQLDFRVFVARHFRDEPLTQGVSIFLYRTYVNPTSGSPVRRLLPNGDRSRPVLPLDLHFLATAWAGEASLQHEIAGWMMRVFEDNPVLSPALLNSYRPDVFRADEAVELTVAPLSVEDLFRIWEVLIQHDYQLSVPYVARLVEIESRLTEIRPSLVQERVDEVHRIR